MEIQPHNKQVRFNIKNIDLTMAKSNRNSTEVPVKNAAKAKRVHTISGFKPFLPWTGTDSLWSHEYYS